MKAPEKSNIALTPSPSPKGRGEKSKSLSPWERDLG